jgi:hypothetical protein
LKHFSCKNTKIELTVNVPFASLPLTSRNDSLLKSLDSKPKRFVMSPLNLYFDGWQQPRRQVFLPIERAKKAST